MGKHRKDRRNFFGRLFKRGQPEEVAIPQGSGKKRGSLVEQYMREWTQSALAIQGGTYDYNPDDLIIDKGIGVRIYQDMRRDPYVKAALNIKKFAVSRLPSSILPASKDAQHQEHAKFIEWNLETMDTSMDTMLWGIMDFVDVGYSIGEQNFRLVDRGDFKGKFAMKSIKSKDPYVYTFRIDDYGNIKTVLQRIGSYVSREGHFDAKVNFAGQQEFPPEKFIIASFQPLYSNPYGNSDLRAAYRAFFIKDWAWKFRAIFIEKWGMPPVIGKFPNGTKETRRKELEEVLDSIQNDTVLTVPEDLTIEILEIAGKGSTTEFERAIDDLNKEILVGIMGSFLSVEEGKRTGARAQGQVHFNVSKLWIEHLARVTEDVINKQIVKKMVDLNYSDVDKYPKFRFELNQAAEMKIEMEIDKELREMQVPLDNAYFYKKYGRPEPELSTAARPVGQDPNLPEGQPMNQMKASFEGMRNDSLPEDPQKIGKLREHYQFFFRLHEVNTGRGKFGEANDKAYKLAGMERDLRSDSGEWMESDQAWSEFLKEALRG